MSRIAVLASGEGTNLQALLDSAEVGPRVVLVVSDRERAVALDRARSAGVEAVFCDPAPHADRDAYGGALLRTLEGIDVVALAGFMRILSPVVVHAFEDPRVVAGQGTIGVELAEQAAEAETALVPIGGGGLAAGISIALRELLPQVRIVGVTCPPGLTIADGIAVKHRGELASSILERTLDDTVEVSDEEGMVRFPVPEQLGPAVAAYEGKDINLGLRPETITRQGTQRPGKDLFTFARAVDVVEPTGPDTMLVFTLGGIEAIARVHPEDQAPVGAAFTFEVDMAKVKLFDPATGKRLGAPTRPAAV